MSVWSWAAIGLVVGAALVLGIMWLIGRELREYDRDHFPLECLLVVVFLFLPTPTFAQADVVAKVKAAVLANGLTIGGPCGAFQITKRVAWRLRASGVGLVAKNPSQTQCEGFGTDALMYRTGMVIDLLVDAGGANGPTWNDAGTTDVSLWRAPIDPGDSIGQVDAPVDPQQPQNPVGGPVTPDVIRAIVASEVDRIYAQNERIFANLGDVAQMNKDAILGRLDKLQEDINNPGWFKKVVSNRYFQIIAAGAAMYFGRGMFGNQQTTQGAQ